MHDRPYLGLTLIELLVTLSVIGILAGVGAPSMVQLVQGSRLHAAAQAVAANLRLAREQTLQSGAPMSVSFLRQSPERWCCIVSARPAMSCELPATGEALIVRSDDFPGIHLLTARFAGRSYTQFDSPRGTARAGRVSLGYDDHEVSIVVSVLGRSRVCSRNDRRFPTC